MKWILLFGALVVLLGFDLWLARRESHGAGMSVKKATVHSIGWLAVALGFGAVVLAGLGGRDAGLYFAGFLVEKSLSLDNVFVFLLILTSFGIPEAQRHRLLTWGIVAALVLRGVFIVIGATALHHASWISYLFAVLLVWTGWRMFQHRHDSAGETAFVEKLKARLPGASVSAAAVAALVIADIVFAIDSVPSILAITDDPFIVFAANAFALLGLAPLFFLVADLVERLYYLKTALAALLVLIGGKMAAGEAFGKLGPEFALPAIALVLGTGVVASLIRDRRLERDAGQDGKPAPA
jgi:tellurite resistance protein TerC